MKMNIIKLLLISSILLSAQAFAWGSWYQTDSHKYIDQQAFTFIKKDKALEDTLFPAIADITSNEGVDWNSIGPGPDTEDGELFSNHYYNPKTGRGNAPKSVSKWFTYLSQQLLSGGTLLPKSAAWGGHYLADMSVVFHVTGMFREDYEKLNQDQTGGGHGDAVILTEDESGERRYLSYKMATTHSENFKAEGDAYLNDVVKHPKHDWFDPWYWNGYTLPTSSHLSWEAMVRNSIDADKLKYSILWRNGEPTFENPFDAQAEMAKEFTADMADSTRTSVFSYATYSDQGLTQAVESVATLWRASVSALRMREPIIEPFSYSNEPTKGKFIVHGAILNYTDVEDAINAKVKLQIISGATLIEGDAVQNVGTIRKRDGVIGGRWVIDTPDIKKVKIKMETIGHFSTVPDLQYTTFEKPLETFDDTVHFIGKTSGDKIGKIDFIIHNKKLSGNIEVGDNDFSTSLYALMNEDGTFTANGFGKLKTPKEVIDGQGTARGTVVGRKLTGTWKFIYMGYDQNGNNGVRSISGSFSTDIEEQVVP